MSVNPIYTLSASRHGLEWVRMPPGRVISSKCWFRLASVKCVNRVRVYTVICEDMFRRGQASMRVYPTCWCVYLVRCVSVGLCICVVSRAPPHTNTYIYRHTPSPSWTVQGSSVDIECMPNVYLGLTSGIHLLYDGMQLARLYPVL